MGQRDSGEGAAQAAPSLDPITTARAEQPIALPARSQQPGASTSAASAGDAQQQQHEEEHKYDGMTFLSVSRGARDGSRGVYNRAGSAMHGHEPLPLTVSQRAAACLLGRQPSACHACQHACMFSTGDARQSLLRPARSTQQQLLGAGHSCQQKELALCSGLGRPVLCTTLAHEEDVAGAAMQGARQR